MDFPWLIAHRGAMAEAPENGQAAFDLAFFRGVDGIEFDVQLSADNVPVIFHDDTLVRTAGIKGSISDHTLEDLRQLDMGIWFSDKYSGSRIMTLAEVLQRYCHQGILMIELKSVSGGQRLSGGLNLLARKVAEDILVHVPANRKQNIFILSFDADMLADVHWLLTDLCFVLNIRKPWLFSTALKQEIRRMLWGYCLAFKRVTGKFVRQSHAAGKTVAVYSCNHPDDADQAAVMGVDVIMTDAPAQVVKAFRSGH